LTKASSVVIFIIVFLKALGHASPQSGTPQGSPDAGWVWLERHIKVGFLAAGRYKYGMTCP
jgi:hypothetical protein